MTIDIITLAKEAGFDDEEWLVSGKRKIIRYAALLEAEIRKKIVPDGWMLAQTTIKMESIYCY